MLKVKVTYEYELDHTLLTDILSTALTGNDLWTVDWSEEDMKAVKANHPEITDWCIEDVLAALLEDGKTFTLIDNEEDKEYAVTAEMFANGIALYEKDHGTIQSIMEDSDFDLWDGDAVLQLAVFGEVIYG